MLLYLAFTADGKLLVTAAADDTVRVWDAATGDMVQRESDTGAGDLAVAPDDKWGVSSGPRGVRSWPVDRCEAVPSDLAELRGFIEAATTAEVDAAGRSGTPR